MARGDWHPSEKYCVLRQGNSWYAVPAAAVREVSTGETAVLVPLSPPALVGLCQARNEFLPVLRLAVLAGEDESITGQDERLLVMTGPSGPWAISVGEVAALDALEVSVDADAKDPESWTAAILGSATYQERVVRVLDPNRLYRFAERELRDYWESDFAARSGRETPSGSESGIVTCAQGVRIV